MDTQTEVTPATNGDAPESDQAEQDGLLSQDQQELSERVAHLEKRVREQEDEIVCLKAALADVMRRLGQVESTKSQNSILPSRPFKTPAPRKQERPKSQLIESSNFTPRSSAPSSARHTPRGASANTMKKWGSTEDTHGHKKERTHSASSQLNQSKRLSTSQGSLKSAISRGSKQTGWNSEEKSVRIYLKGRPVTIFAPSTLDEYDIGAGQKVPDQKLELEWVYGYRGRDCRSNLATLATGEAIFFTAAVVVMQNFDEQSQRHYLEHTDDIKCLAIHPDQIKVATGQVAGHEKKDGKLKIPAERKPHVRVWESINLTTLHVIGVDVFQRGVCCVSFSKVDGGKHLLAVDESNEHALSVWDVSRDNKFHKIAICKSSGDPVTQCEFHPTEENSIVCCGKSQISFWTLEEKKLDKRAGIFQSNEKPKVIICFCFTESGEVVSGDSSGNIYVWEKGSNKIRKAIPNAHEGGVFSVCATKDGCILSGGGKDGKIYQWDSEFQKSGEGVEIQKEYGGVRMISQGPGNMLLVGTIRNCILQGNMELSFAPVVEGHMDELWGLDTSPNKFQFLTAGSDKHIFLWDAQTHSCVWKKEIAESAHCCTIHPELEVAAIGLEIGKWIVLDLQSHEIVGVYHEGKEQQECIQYSPDGKMLAIGNRDNSIYIYEVSEDGKKYFKIGCCRGHSSFVTHVDWSIDSQFLRSNSGDYELLFWHSKTCKQETQKEETRDLEWATQFCVLSFDCLGCWPEGADGTDINGVAASHNKKLLASADDYGKVNLFEYPSIQPRATGHSYGGHSSHVTSTNFMYDDSRLISTGGRDCSVMQWHVQD